MSDDHISSPEADASHQHGEDNGCVTRCIWKNVGGNKQVCTYAGHNHKENGFNYQKGVEADWYNLDFINPGEARNRYEKLFTRPWKQAWRDPTQVDKVWHMGAGPYAHLNFIGSEWWPWPNNAHHIVPVGVLSSILEVEQLKVLQAGKYNVHKGVNIIYLPKWTRYSNLFLLPRHPNYHSTYSADVKAKVEEIADELNEAAETADENGHPKVSKETAPRLGSRLHAFSRIMRRQLREFGKQHPGSHINALFKSMPSL